MPTVGAHVLVRMPEVSPEPVLMTIIVPPGDEAIERITTHAKVLSIHYTQLIKHQRECLWCGESPDGGMIFWNPDPAGGQISSAPPGPYCSTSCWLAAS